MKNHIYNHAIPSLFLSCSNSKYNTFLFIKFISTGITVLATGSYTFLMFFFLVFARYICDKSLDNCNVVNRIFQQNISFIYMMGHRKLSTQMFYVLMQKTNKRLNPNYGSIFYKYNHSLISTPKAMADFIPKILNGNEYRVIHQFKVQFSAFLYFHFA